MTKEVERITLELLCSRNLDNAPTLTLRPKSAKLSFVSSHLIFAWKDFKIKKTWYASHRFSMQKGYFCWKTILEFQNLCEFHTATTESSKSSWRSFAICTPDKTAVGKSKAGWRAFIRNTVRNVSKQALSIKNGEMSAADFNFCYTSTSWKVCPIAEWGNLEHTTPRLIWNIYCRHLRSISKACL